jgi:hypothetical protein
MDKGGQRLVLDCLGALNTLADFNCSCGHGLKAAKVTGKMSLNFFEIGLWYSNKRIVSSVLNLYSTALKSCYSESKRIEFRTGRDSLRRTILRASRLLHEEQPKWRRHAHQISELLSMYRGAYQGQKNYLRIPKSPRLLSQEARRS